LGVCCRLKFFLLLWSDANEGQERSAGCTRPPLHSPGCAFRGIERILSGIESCEKGAGEWNVQFPANLAPSGHNILAAIHANNIARHPLRTIVHQGCDGLGNVLRSGQAASGIP